MFEGTPSQTALRVARQRAAHQLYDVPTVFEDQFALAILGPEVTGAGFHELVDEDSDAMAARYFERRSDSLIPRGPMRYAVAHL